MTIKNLLKQWQITIPEDTYLFEYLLVNKKSNCFFIDKLPLAISKENSNKFDQIDVFFQEVLDGKVVKDDFLKIETKYRNVMTKLWLYNKLYVEFDMETVNKEKVNDVVEPQYQNLFASITDNIQEIKIIEILEKEQVEFWVQMGIRDVAFPVFYFKDYQLLLAPSWSCYVAYLHDQTKLDIIKNIVMSEGLFIRLPNEI